MQHLQIGINVINAMVIFYTRCSANLDFCIKVLFLGMCSENLVLNFRPVWPMYILSQSLQVNLYTPDLSWILEVFVCFGLIICSSLLVVLLASVTLCFFNSLLKVL